MLTFSYREFEKNCNRCSIRQKFRPKLPIGAQEGASESNYGMPSSHKWGSANGSIDGASDSAWAEYHSSGYYNYGEFKK